MNTPIYPVRIRRDAHTTTVMQVARHELPILQTIFGEENVHNRAGRPLAGDHAGEISEVDATGFRDNIDPGEEYDRLAFRYGGNEEGGLYVEQVYGKKMLRGLDKAIEVAKLKTDARKDGKADDSRK